MLVYYDLGDRNTTRRENRVHISEGILNAPVLGASVAVAAAGVGYGLRSMDDRRTVTVAIVASALFAASFIRVPVAAGSVHLVFNGLAGLLLGWQAFPALAVALLIQSAFGFGGLSTIGVNTLIMATPAVCVHYLLRGRLAAAKPDRGLVIGIAAGVLAILMSVILQAGFLLTAGREFAAIAGVLALTAIPLAAIEGAVTGAAIVFLLRVRPDILALHPTSAAFAATVTAEGYSEA